MSTYLIDGKKYAELLSGGATLLRERMTELNALNVFPVADGDTGTNMSCTIDGGLSACNESCDSIGEFAQQFSRASLLAARGNSGVILSQIFAGITEILSGCDTADAVKLAEAYKNGIKTSYGAVQNPTEGTILTVFRESAEYAAERINADSTIEQFLEYIVDEARRSLERTPDLLPALAEADVIDSGGAGYLAVAEGMYLALTGRIDISVRPVARAGESSKVNIDSFTRDSILEYGYCTEFMLRLTTNKVDPDTFDINIILSALTDMGGESVVAYKTGDVVKVHVHTFNPGEILTMAQKYGEFLTVKVENMSLGHSGDEQPKPKKARKKRLATVAVSSGEGISALFKDMGADVIISGGQTANPSIEEFVKAFEECNADNIIVLPNNKNILLAARGAQELYDGAKIWVVETKSLMQGYSALSVINPGISDIEVIVSGAERAAKSVIDCEITRAVRDVSIDGRAISEGDYMAISRGSIAAIGVTAEDAVMATLEDADTDLSEIVTLITGKDVDADRRVCLTERIEEEYPDLEIVVYEGGQDVYDYLLAIE